jgi:hypothetical protein
MKITILLRAYTNRITYQGDTWNGLKPAQDVIMKKWVLYCSGLSYYLLEKNTAVSMELYQYYLSKCDRYIVVYGFNT